LRIDQQRFELCPRAALKILTLAASLAFASGCPTIGQ